MIKFSFVIPILNTTVQDDSKLKTTLASINVIDTNYEILLINTTGNNIDKFIDKIKNSYNIIYIDTKNKEFVESFNIGILACNGEYVIPTYEGYTYIKSFDKIYDELDSSIGIFYFGNRIATAITFRNYDHYALYRGNIIFNRERISKMPFIYEAYYKNYDKKLLLTALHHDIQVIYINGTIVDFRNVTAVNFMEITDPRTNKCYNYTCGDNLTCIIPFKNENSEVERTVQSIRATTDGVRIILINDGSDDDYDYEWVANKFNCIYYKNEHQTGSGPAKQKGIELCKTENFLLLDAHMRFFEDNWDKILNNTIINNPNTILCLNTIVMHKDEKYGYIENENGNVKINTKAAYMKITDEWNTFDAKWANNYVANVDLFGLRDIAVILGATYATTKTYWNYLHGYEGLIGYGLEEPFISAKCWLSGGRCAKFNTINVGHIYRQQFPYTVKSWQTCVNRILLMNCIFDENNIIKNSKIIKSHGKHTYNEALTYFNNNINYYQPLINDIKSKFTKPLSYFLEINDKAK